MGLSAGAEMGGTGVAVAGAFARTALVAPAKGQEPGWPLLTRAVAWVAVGLAAQLVGYWGLPRAWVLTTFWFVLLMGAAVLLGVVSGNRRRAVVVGEAILAVTSLQALWPVVAPTPWQRPAPAARAAASGVSWSASFTALDQRLLKEIPRPDGWERSARPYVRIDLGRDYKGPAGFLIEVNGHDLGEVSNRTLAPGTEPPPTIPAWTVFLPRAVLAESPLVTVVLRPTALDPLLSVAGHGDPLVEPLGDLNSFFYDGAAWSNDRLAGPRYRRAVGTYRIWLSI